ncbi:hypothetical protein, conserved [Eimeria acervulina]|uniref:Uncharacterized protein n=1 Tax=Eimeria acervulina TaxID=5801 RepID=U6GST1_EIMAC|nr:hypothetical protein, conserved [Eimeria acervulina]CDI82607.1 hypothetical protein, conserved [Eimeria acervulina]
MQICGTLWRHLPLQHCAIAARQCVYNPTARLAVNRASKLFQIFPHYRPRCNPFEFVCMTCYYRFLDTLRPQLHTMSQDLAFVEQQLIRAMAEPQMDQSLSHTLGRLRELRGVVASILARHTAVAEANGVWLQQSDMLNSSEREFAQWFWSRDFPLHNAKLMPPAASTLVNHPVGNTSSASRDMEGSEPRPVEESMSASGQVRSSFWFQIHRQNARLVRANDDEPNELLISL